MKNLKIPRGVQPIGVHRYLSQADSNLLHIDKVSKQSIAPSAWHNTPAGRVWRLQITSPQARALRLHFKHFNVGRGKVWLRTSQGHTKGPYSGQGPLDDGDFWTEPVHGDTLTVEYHPYSTNAEQGVPFQISTISHILDGPINRNTFANNSHSDSRPSQMTKDANNTLSQSIQIKLAHPMTFI